MSSPLIICRASVVCTSSFVSVAASALSPRMIAFRSGDMGCSPPLAGCAFPLGACAGAAFPASCAAGGSTVAPSAAPAIRAIWRSASDSAVSFAFAPPFVAAMAALYFSANARYRRHWGSWPLSRQKHQYAFIISSEFGFMMAQLSPFCSAMVKNAAVTISRSGRPNEMFEMPSIVRPPCWQTARTVCNVASGALSSELTAIASGSMTMSLREMP